MNKKPNVSACGSCGGPLYSCADFAGHYSDCENPDCAAHERRMDGRKLEQRRAEERIKIRKALWGR